MNLIEHVVTKVLSASYYNRFWCVDVEADAYGHVSKTTLYFNTKEQADDVKVGYKFDA